MMSVVEGRRDWYPAVTGKTLRAPEPDVYMRHFAVDERGWLVLLSTTAEEGWESAVTKEGYVTDAEQYRSIRTDVWDLTTREYLGTHVVDEWETSLFFKGGETLLNVPEMDLQLRTLTLGLYRLGVRRQ